MCFESQFYKPISILLNIHDLFSVSVVNFAVSIVNFAVSKHAHKRFFSGVYVHIQQEVLNHTVKEI